MNKFAILAQFELQTSWFLNTLEGISDAESNLQVAENLNPIKWIVGHLISCRSTLLIALGKQSNFTQYHTLFGKGSSNKMGAATPDLETIKTDWLSVSVDLKATLHNTSEEQLSAKAPFQTSIPDETLLGLFAFFAIHEGFHIGQLSILRKQLGKTVMLMSRR
ncbi:DinB family protein [Runella sp. MFBS21]|uniref:DinB family protein n=1 Tax=Runella sp. MFBS21 TaxID=3034018 RepID=UPI0023FA3AB1|nr:DinB family protein [Runella sp. MFBS21]MDF7819250.1 DinB family protein [Runella sp. MFBS21]